MRYYHITETINVSSIIKEGLLLSKFGSGGICGVEDVTPNMDIKRIFLTTEPDQLSALDIDFSPDYHDLSLLEIDVTGITLHKDTEYPEETDYVFYVLENIPSERILSSIEM